MHRFIPYIMITGMLMGNLMAIAQQGFYVPKKGKVYFAGDTATIFSSVHNQGNLGMDKKAVVNFKGQVWENDPAALITDESNGGNGTSGIGGWIRFLSDSGRQKIYGGYNAATKTGPSFPHLQVYNRWGVELMESSLKVRREIALSNGFVYLNDKILVLGHNYPGTISGYDPNRFFVTGTGPNGGMLLRENIRERDGLVVFPVGTREEAYTPAAIKSQSPIGDDYYVSVFDGVRSGVINGNGLAAEGVNKTWQIGKMLRPGEDDVEIFLQHLKADEGARFSLNRRNAYIAQYNANSWDEGYPQQLPESGYLTTGSLLTNSGVNNRVLHFTLSNTSYFTKLTGSGDTASSKTNLLLTAHRVNSSIVRVRWQTKPEINIHTFVVQRRLYEEAEFKNVDTLRSQARDGVSFSYLIYENNDPNSYKGISFYRLKVMDYNNRSYYSRIVAVGGPSFYSVKLWPNPTPDKFYMIIDAPNAHSVMITDNLGRNMWSNTIDLSAQAFVEIKNHRLLPGTYYVSVLDNKRTILATEKLLIINR